MYIATVQCLNYTGKDSKKTNQFTVYVFETLVTLKQGQGHKTLYDLVDPKQDYNQAKFERT